MDRRAWLLGFLAVIAAPRVVATYPRQTAIDSPGGPVHNARYMFNLTLANVRSTSADHPLAHLLLT